MRGIYYTNRLVTILVLSVTMIACASSAAAPAPPIDQDKAISSFRNYSADYIVYDTPTKLAASSELVVTGSLAEVRVGRSMQNPDASWDKWTTTIMVIRSASTLAGKNRNSDTSVVYVELPNPSNMQLSEFRQALPVNARVVLYLSRAASKAENPDVASVNGNDDIDSSLYLPVSPQGFGMEDAQELTIVWPLAGSVLKGSLRDASPGGNVLPVD